MNKNISKKDALSVPKASKFLDKIQYFVNGKFVCNLNASQTCQLRVNIVKYINETNDTSILNDFYFIGHKDSNSVPGEEIKITMDEFGNFSDSPWELNQIRRHMYKLMVMERLKKGYENKDIDIEI